MAASFTQKNASREGKKPRSDQRMVLTGADRDAFLDAVMNPPGPTEKLVAALRRHQQLLGYSAASRT